MQAVMPPLPPAAGPAATPAEATRAQLRDKAREFEAYYVQQFVALTRPDFSDNELMGGGFAESTFTQFMDEEIGKAVAQRGGIGLANRVYAELLKMQEATEAAATNTVNQGEQP